MLVADINATGSSDPFELTTVNRTLFFHADNGVNGRELWKLDTVNPSLTFLSDFNADILIDGPADISWFGDTVSSAGDFNGDGLEDIVVSSSISSSSGNGGVAYIFFGRNTTNPINFQSEADADVILRGQSNVLDDFGRSITSAGDFNGDGFDDIIVGAPFAGNNGLITSGSAFIFFGRNPAGQITLRADLDADVTIDGQDTNDFIATSVDSAGEFNGDGLDDVIVSGILNDNNGLTDSGSAFIFFGRSSTTPLNFIADADADIILNGQSAEDHFGSPVSSAGDFNGDGLGDVIVTASDDDNNGLADSGSAFIFFGQNPTGQIQFMADAGADVILEGQVEVGLFGIDANSAGDFNGDGLTDVIVGQIVDSQNQETGVGSAFIFFGRNPTSQLVLRTDTDAEIIMDGSNAGDNFGSSASPGNGIASAGDFNGDGLDDVIVGAFAYDNGTFGSNVGRAYVFFGKNTDLPIISLFGDNPATVEAWSTFLSFGASAQDFIDGDITALIVEGPLDVSTLGAKTVTYDVVNSRGFTDHKERIVNVVDTTPPVITLNGNNSEFVEVGTTYIDLGATALDNFDGDVTVNIIVGGLPININVLGTYIVTYNVSDSSGNAATQVTRTVNVVDTTSPVVTAPANVITEATGTTTLVAIGTATATDTSGNSSSATQQITVNPVPLVQLQLLKDFFNSLGLSTGLHKKLDKKLNEAEAKIISGDNAGAIKALNSFITTVQSKTPQDINQADSDEMVQRAQAIIALL